MAKGGEAFSHKCSRTTGIKIYNPNFHKEFATLDHSCSNRQQSCSDISPEDGWYPQSTVSKNQQVNFELSAISSDHNYCRAPSKQVECHSRSGFQECNRLIQLETSSRRLSENNQTHRNPSSRSIYLQAVPPTYEIETRSKQFCNKFKAAGIEQNVWFCIPTLQLNRSGDKQGSSENVEAMILVITTWQKQSCYTLLLRMAIQHPLLLPVPPPPDLLLNPLGEKHPLVKTRSLSVAGVENYSKSFEIEGISSSAVNLHIQYPADQVHFQFTYWLGASDLAGVVSNKLI